LVGIVISIKQLREPDLWWQLRTGEYILENKEIPNTDIFSYTFEGEPWINVKWGFEVLMAVTAKLGGPELLFLLQILATCLIVSLWFKMMKARNNNDPPNFSPAFGLAVLLGLFIMEFRINGRPEMTSHVMLAAYALIITKFHFNKKTKAIYWLIPLQILWTNMHEAYGIGMVVIFIFIAAIIFEFLASKFFKISNVTFPTKAILVSLVAILAVALNPKGAKMYFHPFNIFGQLGENKFTTELFDFKNAEYWQIESYLFVGLGILLMVLIGREFLKAKSLKNKFLALQSSFGFPFLILFIAFFYLSLTAHRNIPFFAILAIPFLGNYLSKLIPNKKVSFIAIAATAIVFYVGIASNKYYETFSPREKYGLQLNETKNAIGVANFLTTNNIEGKGFTDYLSSSYLLWKLQPEFKTYLDLRDLDIFTSKFFENVFNVYQNPDAQLANGSTLWDYFDEIDQFQYVVILNNEQFKNLHGYLLKHDSWELVYADGLASIYLPRNRGYDGIIKQHGFNKGANNVFNAYMIKPPNKTANTISKLFWPVYKPTSQKAQIKSYLPTAKLYYQYIGYPNTKID